MTHSQTLKFRQPDLILIDMTLIHRRILSIVVILFGLPWLASCGDEGNSDKIGLDISPNKPFLSLANSSYMDNNGEIQEVAGPWTKATFTISNKHDSLRLFVDSLTITFTTGEGQTKRFTVSLSEVGCADGSARVYYANILPGESFTGDANCDGTPDSESWYFGGLPESESPVLFAEVELSGYFHPDDVTNPSERAMKFATFVTR